MKIDMHTHFVAPDFVEQARRGQAIGGITIENRDGKEWVVHPQGFGYPLHAEYWDMEAKRRDMDRLGIDVSVLSPTPTMFQYGLEAGPAREFCQGTNEALARIVAESNGRLHGMAIVPLQDPEGSAAVLRHAVRDLGLRAAHIGTTVNKVPVDDPRFEPFFAIAEELDVPVVLHPFYVDTRREKFAQYYMTNLIGYMLETCTAAARLILSGCLDRHPKLTLVLVHAGGFLPYQIGRLDHGFRVRITHASIPLKFLIELVGAHHVLLGTDIPFDMADVHFAQHLSALNLDDQTMEAISSENAIRIFGLDGNSAGLP
jgi:aminocarboxymuconate-semialdehyde decarboxylase